MLFVPRKLFGCATDIRLTQMPVLAQPLPSSSYRAWEVIGGDVFHHLLVQERTKGGLDSNRTLYHRLMYRKHDHYAYRIIYSSDPIDFSGATAHGTPASSTLSASGKQKKSAKRAKTLRLVLAVAQSRDEIFLDWERVKEFRAAASLTQASSMLECWTDFQQAARRNGTAADGGVTLSQYGASQRASAMQQSAADHHHRRPTPQELYGEDGSKCSEISESSSTSSESCEDDDDEEILVTPREIPAEGTPIAGGPTPTNGCPGPSSAYEPFQPAAVFMRNPSDAFGFTTPTSPDPSGVFPSQTQATSSNALSQAASAEYSVHKRYASYFLNMAGVLIAVCTAVFATSYFNGTAGVGNTPSSSGLPLDNRVTVALSTLFGSALSFLWSWQKASSKASKCKSIVSAALKEEQEKQRQQQREEERKREEAAAAKAQLVATAKAQLAAQVSRQAAPVRSISAMSTSSNPTSIAASSLSAAPGSFSSPPRLSKRAAEKEKEVVSRASQPSSLNGSQTSRERSPKMPAVGEGGGFNGSKTASSVQQRAQNSGPLLSASFTQLQTPKAPGQVWPHAIKVKDLNSGAVYAPNSAPFPIKTEYFEGICYPKVVTNPRDAKLDAYFNGKKRKFEIQFQGKFNFPKEHLNPDGTLKGFVCFAAGLPEKLELTFTLRSLGRIIVSVFSKLTRGAAITLGNESPDHLPAFTSYAAHAMDALVESDSFETAPLLGVPMLPDTGDLSRMRKTEKHDKVCPYLPNKVYSCSFHSQYADFDNWSMCQVPGIKSMAFRKLWGELPVRVCMLLVPQGMKLETAMRHCKPILAIEIHHRSLPTFEEL